MIQSLDVISVNLWQIIISLANLTILFLIVKKFLFKPAKQVIEKREQDIADRYADADASKKEAMEMKTKYEEQMKNAKAEADEIISNATDTAKHRGEKLVLEARDEAEGIRRRAEQEAELTRKKAVDGIKREIVEVSGVLAEKMIGREIKEEDHRELIDSFIKDIGDGDDGSK